MPKLASNETCTGCSACANVCPKNTISMIEDREGFLFPFVDDNRCVNCRLCEKTCPIISDDKKNENDSPDAYAAWSKLDRCLSSSGGAFAAFARYVLKMKGVVFGAVLNEDFRVTHQFIERVEDLSPLRGSKYVQSDVSASYPKVKEFLNQNRLVLFSGTPCQVAGLKAFLRKDYENLVTLDLVCHGVPSYRVFKSYLEKFSKRKKLDERGMKIDGFEFRRREGWDKTPYISVDGKFHAIYGADALFTEAFDSAAIFRKCCYNCRYSTLPRVGDCTIADFWGLGLHGDPFKEDVSKGVSLILTNSTKGLKYMSALDDVFLEKRTLSEALVENHNLRNRTESYANRDGVIDAFLSPDKQLDCINREFSLVDKSFKARIKRFVRKMGVLDFAKRIYRIVRMVSK